VTDPQPVRDEEFTREVLSELRAIRFVLAVAVGLLLAMFFSGCTSPSTRLVLEPYREPWRTPGLCWAYWQLVNPSPTPQTITGVEIWMVSKSGEWAGEGEYMEAHVGREVEWLTTAMVVGQCGEERTRMTTVFEVDGRYVLTGNSVFQ
jgi:hypothetical protein